MDLYIDRIKLYISVTQTSSQEQRPRPQTFAGGNLNGPLEPQTNNL